MMKFNIEVKKSCYENYQNLQQVLILIFNEYI